MKSLFKPFERLDLKHLSETFESVFGETLNKKSRNVICGSIYRHPTMMRVIFILYGQGVTRAVPDTMLQLSLVVGGILLMK